MRKLISTIMVVVLALALISSCGKKEPVKAIFADAGWGSIQFHNAVMMFIAETAYDLETEQISGSTPITWAAFLTGEINVYSEVWTDNLVTYDEDIASGAIEELSLNFADNAQGLYVPRYVIEGDAERDIAPMAPDLVTVEDLKNYPDVFADPNDSSMGRILGSISGWAVDEIIRAKYEFYGLNEMYNYVDPGSDSALAASFKAAYIKGEAIVGYYWEPTWLTGQYDLYLLQDAPYDEDLYPLGQTECPAVDVTVCINAEFKEAAPEYCEFLSKYETSSALTAEALGYVQTNSAEMDDAAKWFLMQHDELIDQWLPTDKAEMVRDALNG